MFIQGINGLDVHPLTVSCNAIWIGEIENRITLSAQLNALVLAWQKATRPLACGDGLVLSAATQRCQHDKSGQILGSISKAVCEPGAHARPSRDLRASVHKHMSRVVINGIGRHRANQTNVINDRTDFWEQRTDFGLVFAKLLKWMLRTKADERRPLELGDLLPFCHRLWHRLAIHLRKFWLGIECFEVTGPAGHTQPDHALGFPPPGQRLASGEGSTCLGIHHACDAGEAQGCERDETQSLCRATKQRPARHLLGVCLFQLILDVDWLAHCRVIVSWRLMRIRAMWDQAASSGLSLPSGTRARPVFK